MGFHVVVTLITPYLLSLRGHIPSPFDAANSVPPSRRRRPFASCCCVVSRTAIGGRGAASGLIWAFTKLDKKRLPTCPRKALRWAREVQRRSGHAAVGVLGFRVINVCPCCRDGT